MVKRPKVQLEEETATVPPTPPPKHNKICG